MENIDTFHRIKTEMLNPKYFFQSLLEQAASYKIISDKELLLLYEDLLSLVAEQADKFVRGESSSIPIEKVQEITTSVLFVVGVQLKSYQTPEIALDIIKSKSLKSVFENGLKLIRKKTVNSRALQESILKNLLDTPNVYYRSTIVDGINGFFKLYSPQFAAHEIRITADYPIFIGRVELDGIEFIEKYLYYIHAENAFCQCFESNDIHHLLCGLTPDYISVPLNIFEPVLLSALALVSLNKSPKSLDLNENDISFLYCKLLGMPKTEVQIFLQKNILKLKRIMDIPQMSVEYAFLCIPKLSDVILNAINTKTLDKIFLIPAYPENEDQIFISYGDRMNDKKYQDLLDRILCADSSKEKIALIFNEVHSLADLLDILSDAMFASDELDSFINMLPLSVFAVLLSQYPSDDFLNRESEQLLFAALQKRKQAFSIKEQAQIKQALSAFKNE